MNHRSLSSWAVTAEKSADIGKRKSSVSAAMCMAVGEYGLSCTVMPNARNWFGLMRE
jgi:hypothetical protein